MLQAFGSKTAQICRNNAKMRLFLQSTRIAISFSSNRTKFYWLKFCLYLQHYSYNIKNLVRENKDTWGFNVIADESISYIRLFQCSDILYTYYFNHSSSHSFPRLFQISRNSFTFKLITLILGYAAERIFEGLKIRTFSQSLTRKIFNST